jgi:hypothetical protein
MSLISAANDGRDFFTCLVSCFFISFMFLSYFLIVSVLRRLKLGAFYYIYVFLSIQDYFGLGTLHTQCALKLGAWGLTLAAWRRLSTSGCVRIFRSS